MKIVIDEIVFNQTITDGKLEVAEWLLEQNCPVKPTVYVQNMSLNVLNWLLSKSLTMDKHYMQYVIEKTNNHDVINWFITQGMILDYTVINSCIKGNKLELMVWLMNNNVIQLTSDNYTTAVMTENISILDYLKSKNCPYEDVVSETALKYMKKNSIKWLVRNNFF